MKYDSRRTQRDFCDRGIDVTETTPQWALNYHNELSIFVYPKDPVRQ